MPIKTVVHYFAARETTELVMGVAVATRRNDILAVRHLRGVHGRERAVPTSVHATREAG